MRKGNRGGDRVVSNRGVLKSYSTSLLPPSTYRVLTDSWYDSGYPAVYPSSRRAVERLPDLISTVVPRRFPAKPGRQARLSLGRSIYLPMLREMPSRVKECIKRSDRREVLFAFKRAGYSGSAPKRHYNRKLFSRYGC